MTPNPSDLPDAGNALTVTIGRALGAVVVTVHGAIDPLGSELLEGVLTDLIDGQGNLLVAVDLGKAVVEPEALTVFITAAERARLRGAKFALKEPPNGTDHALQTAGLADFVELQGGAGRVGTRRPAPPAGTRDGYGNQLPQ